MEGRVGNAKSAISSLSGPEMNKIFRKYLMISIILFGITRFYGLFAHGVTSITMESMAIAVLIAGLTYVLILKMIPGDAPMIKWFRLFYNTALAFFINDLFIKGVLTIAGGSSTYESILFSLSMLFGIMSCGIYFFILIRSKTKLT
jgi:hypothetical protein